MDIREVEIVLSGRPGRRATFSHARFEQRWCSDAIVAVCRGVGRTVYPAAITISDEEAASGKVRLNPSVHLAPFRDLPARVIGWAHRPDIGWHGEVAPTADRTNWDSDWALAARTRVSAPVAAPPASVPSAPPAVNDGRLLVGTYDDPRGPVSVRLESRSGSSSR